MDHSSPSVKAVLKVREKKRKRKRKRRILSSTDDNCLSIINFLFPIFSLIFLALILLCFSLFFPIQITTYYLLLLLLFYFYFSPFSLHLFYFLDYFSHSVFHFLSLSLFLFLTLLLFPSLSLSITFSLALSFSFSLSHFLSLFKALAAEALLWDPKSLDKRTLSSLAEVFQVLHFPSSSLFSFYSVLISLLLY